MLEILLAQKHAKLQQTLSIWKVSNFHILPFVYLSKPYRLVVVVKYSCIFVFMYFYVNVDAI